MSKDNSGPAAEIPLVSGGAAIVSVESLERIQGDKWRRGTNGYVYKVGARKKGVPCLLHRIVTAAKNGFDVHHKNGIKTDCRIENLEILDPSEHQKHHSHLVIARNKASQIHSDHGTCLSCGRSYLKNPSHRGSQKYCGQPCAKADLKNARARNKNASK
jgi:HNH endonuclease